MKPILLFSLAAVLLGCGKPSTGVEDERSVSDLAQSASSARYQLQFIVETNQGEITSAPFPSGGIGLNTKDPWRQLSVAAVPISLNNYTHGDWASHECAEYADIRVNWDIAGTSPVRSFAGSWLGELRVWRGRTGLNLAFAGGRVGGPGQISNVVTNNNAAYEERGPGDSYFLLRLTDARMGFGSPSSPDGNGTLAALPGYEAACANFSLKATRLP
jgi:hypothetical protein